MRKDKMPEHKRLSNKFEWLPPEKRPSRFPGAKPPRKPETRKPLFFLARDGDDVYFVNDSTETLNTVVSDAGGLLNIDDEEDIGVSGPKYSYENVLPGEAVKVENYHPMFDSDFLLQLEVKVWSPAFGGKTFRAIGKGGVKETVLFWDTGEAGKDVHMGP
jgi:hypothetical protein